MRALLAVALLIAWTLASSEEPGHDKAVAQKDQKTEQKAASANEVPAPLETPKAETEKRTSDKAAAHSEDKTNLDRELVKYTGELARFTEWLVYATIVIALIGAYQGWKLRDTVKLSREEFISTHRPKLRVRNVVVHRRDGMGLFQDGQHVNGQFYVTNVGGTGALITGIGCWVWPKKHMGTIQSNALPMELPYEGRNPNIELKPRLKAGASCPVPFQSDVVLANGAAQQIGSPNNEMGGKWRLFVMGFVEYSDDTGTPRRTAFCREFSPEQRFIKVENEDYENEE
jgi:hypothetical protein